MGDQVSNAQDTTKREKRQEDLLSTHCYAFANFLLHHVAYGKLIGGAYGAYFSPRGTVLI